MAGSTPTKPSGDGSKPKRMGRRSLIPGWIRHVVLLLVLVFVLEYVLVPDIVGASKDLHLLGALNVVWLAAAVTFEAGSVLAFALLTRTLLFEHRVPLFRLVRIVTIMMAVARVIPGGAANNVSGYQLLTASGVDGPTAGFALATQAIGEVIVLAGMLCIALLVSIPFAGLHPIYVVAALAALVFLLVAAALFFLFTRGEESVVRVVRAVGRRVPRVGAERMESVARQASDSVTLLVRDRRLVTRGILWSSLN